ncbi:hypothetical protein HDU97_001399 [Phlyctochytrium planicorne]|nr:hypothetical protein HDU97_001399 [Phlyctochytrium planicorne]
MSTPSFMMLKDAASSLCWDANTLAIGAQLSLQACNTINPTQTLQLNPTTNGTILSAIMDSTGQTLCVEFNASEKALALNKCQSGSAIQSFNLNSATPSLASDAKVCFGPNQDGIISTVDCGKPVAISQVSTAPAKFPLQPYSVKTMNIAGGCLDGTNPKSVVVAKCSGAPAQDWYSLWGQIRNVKNGLCLDAPAATPNDENPINLALTVCGGFPTINSQLWLKSADNILSNSISGNCIHSDGANAQLGTDACGKKDSLKTEKKFTNIESFATDLGNPACNTPRSRKDFRDLSENEQNTFMNAMNTLHQIPSLLGRRNRYHDYVALHGMGAGSMHGTPVFLPWHRYFIAVLENDLQKISGNSSLAVPFWAWGSDATKWALSSTGMLTEKRFGTTGRGSEGCVTDGFMQGNWVPNDQKCLARGYAEKNTDQGVATYTEDFMLLALARDPESKKRHSSYDSFRVLVESLPHNTMHMMIAGNNPISLGAEMGDPAVSVNDPIFWMHHNNIDRYWQYFQRQNPKLAKSYDGEMEYPPYSGNTRKVSKDDVLIGFNVPVSKGLGVREGPLCHRFEPYSKSIGSVIVKQANLARRGDRFARRASSGDDLIMNLDPAVAGKVVQIDASINAASTEKKNLPLPPRPTPAALSDAFLDRMQKFMKMDKAKIRKMEQAAREMMDELRKETDTVLKEEFSKDMSNASFEQHAVAVKVAIAKLSA